MYNAMWQLKHKIFTKSKLQGNFVYQNAYKIFTEGVQTHVPSASTGTVAGAGRTLGDDRKTVATAQTGIPPAVFPQQLLRSGEDPRS